MMMDSLKFIPKTLAKNPTSPENKAITIREQFNDETRFEI